MAGSRIEKLGTIFSRVTGLLESGALKESSKPLWYDVYARFRPHVEPEQLRPEPADQNVVQILYPEDYIRARFYKEFGSPGLINLQDDRKFKNLSELFLEKYIDIAKRRDIVNEDEIFQQAENQMVAEGLRLRRTVKKQEAEEDGGEI